MEKITKRSKPTAITIEMPVPVGLQDPALDVLNQALAVAPLHRLVLTRPAHLSLWQMEVSLLTLLDTLIDTLWLDYSTFGWNGLSWLLASDERLQAANLPAAQLWRLCQLAGELGRPLRLRDFSGQGDVLIPALHHFPPTHETPRALNSLPGWGRTP